MNQDEDGTEPASRPNERPTAFVWSFLASLAGGALLITVAVVSYKICTWIWAWGDKPWYDVPDWVHDFGWIVALALSMGGVVAGITGLGLVIRAFCELYIRFEERRKILAQTSGIIGALFAVPAVLIIGVPVVVVCVMAFVAGMGLAAALWPLVIIALLVLILAKK